MKKTAAFLAILFLLSLLSVSFGAAELVTPLSVDELFDALSRGEDIITLSEDMTFGEDCPSVYIDRTLTLRSSTNLPVTLREGRFIIEGRGDEPVTVVFENIDFISGGDTEAPAIYASGNLDLTFMGCTFKGYNGGGVRLFADSPDSLTATFKNCLFEENRLLSDLGGGVYARGRGGNLTLNMSGCVFELNQSSGGGGLYFREAAVTATDCTFKDNDSKDQGGGIYGERGSLTLNNCLFGGNISKGYGGGVALSGVKLTMLDSVVGGNVAEEKGGGLWLEEAEHPHYVGVDETLMQSYPYNRDVNIDNCSFYLNYSEQDKIARFELLGDIKVKIRLSTFAYHGGEETLRNNPYIDFFGCILEYDGAEKELPSAENGYCLIYDEDGREPTIDSEYRLTDYPHLNCVNDSSALRIPLEAVKAVYGSAFSHYYGAFPVGDNYGEVTLVFPFFPLRTEEVKARRGNPIPEIPAPMRDMYDFGGWVLPDSSILPGYRLLVGGDVSRIEFSPLWTHNTRYYLTLAGVGFAIACGTVGWIVVKKRMKKVITEH